MLIFGDTQTGYTSIKENCMRFPLVFKLLVIIPPPNPVGDRTQPVVGSPLCGVSHSKGKEVLSEEKSSLSCTLGVIRYEETYMTGACAHAHKHAQTQRSSGRGRSVRHGVPLRNRFFYSILRLLAPSTD